MELDTNRIIEQRREKAASLRGQGANPFANDFKPDAKTWKIQELYGARSAEELEGETAAHTLAGRVMAVRDFGNMAFLDLRDGSGRIQLVANKKVIGPELMAEVKKIDVGDIVGVSGRPMRTRTGELSIRIESIRLLTKNIRPLPEKWHGLTDVEVRYRQRYADLIMNPEVRDVFIARSGIIKRTREFFIERDFLEVETPMMHPIAGGATARPFVTHHNALDMPLFLRVAPELYLKRLLVGGFERVFEVNRNFRNEGISIRHNPEFTMLEFYQAYAVHTDLMTLVEALIEDLAMTLHGRTEVEYQGTTIHLTAPFRRVTVEQAVLEHCPELKPEDLRNVGVMRDFAKSLGQETKPSWGWGRYVTGIFEERVEKNLVQPTFVYHYPTEVSPLARRNEADGEIVDRWELFVCGREMANAFSELNDPEDQRSRFEEQMQAKADGDQEAQPFDADYIRALEYGMPPAAGCGIGIDRLVMLLMNQASIRDVILFPQLRPEQ